MWQAEITLTDVRVPEANRLPGANSFKDTARVLAGTRNAVAWGALGHATAAYEIAAQYCAERTQFGKPLVSFQIVQDKLVKMLAEVCSMQLYCLRLGRLIEEGRLTDTIAAIAKMNNTRKAREVVAEARDLLGGNGILLDFHVMRHMADIEALHTYEGTETIQTLIVGQGHHRCQRLRLTSGSSRQTACGCAASVSGSGRPLLIITGLGASLELAAPFERELNRAWHPDDQLRRARRRGHRRRTRGRGGCAGVARTAERLLDALGYGRSTCSASRSAASSPSSSPTRRRHGYAGWCSPPPDRVSAASRARRGCCGSWPRRAATSSPTATGASPGSSTAERPAATPTRCCTGRWPASSTARRCAATSGRSTPSPGWTSMPWLCRLRQPTLVLAGDDDPIVPVVNGRILARLIPDATLHVVRGGGHLFVLEDPAAVASDVAEFLSAAPAGRA